MNVWIAPPQRGADRLRGGQMADAYTGRKKEDAN
jgi:hypothetical protein